MQDPKRPDSREIKRAKARYEGMRRDPSIKKIFPNLDISKTFEEWMELNYETYKERGEKLFFELFMHPELFIFVPFIFDHNLKVDEEGIIIDSKYKLLAIGLPANSITITINYDKVNNINDTIKTVDNKIKIAYNQYHRIKLEEKSYLPKIRIGIDLDITYKIGDIVAKLRKTPPRISWRKIAEECLNSRLFSKDTDIDSAEKTIRDHYWPRYQDLVFKGGWRSL